MFRGRGAAGRMQKGFGYKGMCIYVISYRYYRGLGFRIGMLEPTFWRLHKSRSKKVFRLQGDIQI